MSSREIMNAQGFGKPTFDKTNDSLDSFFKTGKHYE